ncbi:MAG: signal peptidase II [Bacteroidales bacterium]|nr:signal peptidase II [Bacteroidales bacterium]MCM1414473.1 signal peptidase II [bacterium]MCM1422360.1 signal peptidase II [bacterium]
MKNLKCNLLSLLCMPLLILLDQYTKRLAVLHLKGQPPFVLLDRVLEFSYLENTGAAFSSFSGKQTFLIVLTILVILILAWRYVTLPAGKRLVWLRICLLFILSGAVGNLIDRLTRRYVVDFIYFVPIDFPKFNVADIYITVGVAVLAVLLLFYYTEEECESLLSIDFFRKKR